MIARASEVPSISALRGSLRTAYFFDCYCIELPPDSRTPLELYLKVVSSTPRWVNLLMNVRNKIVARIGLKDMGALSSVSPSKAPADYRVGDQAGIFQLIESNDREVILGETDKHLDVRISVVKQQHEDRTTVSVSTVVHVHNMLGRIYMAFVTPAHRIIAPATVSKLAVKQP